MGALANLGDIIAGPTPKSGMLATENDPTFTEKGDPIGHTQFGFDNEVIIDWGPSGESAKLFTKTTGTNSYKGGKFWNNQLIPGVNEKTVRWYGNVLNKGGSYQMITSSCVTKVSITLNLSGVFNVGIHPYLLHAQMYLRNLGVRPSLFLDHIHRVN